MAQTVENNTIIVSHDLTNTCGMFISNVTLILRAGKYPPAKRFQAVLVSGTKEYNFRAAFFSFEKILSVHMRADEYFRWLFFSGLFLFFVFMAFQYFVYIFHSYYTLLSLSFCLLFLLLSLSLFSRCYVFHFPLTNFFLF